jgi:hypothetical protein
MLAIIFILAILVLLMFRMPSLQWDNEEIPVIFTITTIDSVDEITGQMNYDSRVLLLHTGTSDYQNKNLKAKFYKNGQPVSCTIATMNGHDFISTVHMGVQWMGGSGCSGVTWSPGERVCIDFSDGTFHPGNTVQMDIIDKITNATLSRHMFAYK